MKRESSKYKAIKQQRPLMALVAGATRPIGRSIADMLAGEGYRLVLPFIDDWPESAAQLRKEFSSPNQGHMVVPCDLTDRQAVLALMEEVRRNSGNLALLIANIERGGMPVVHGSYDLDINRNQWELEIATTLAAKQNLFDAALPLLKKAPDAAVVNITSIAGVVGRCGPAALVFSDGYSAANRAASQLTEIWARRGAPEVRVNELQLGIMAGRHAEGTRGWTLLSAKEQQAIIRHILLERTGKLQDITEAVHFLACRKNYCTGSVLRLDGGYVLGGEKVGELPAGVLQNDNK